MIALGTVAAAMGASTSVAEEGAVAGGTVSSGSDGGWGSDFESQAARIFAENGGSLNTYTPRVDSGGMVYFGRSEQVPC